MRVSAHLVARIAHDFHRAFQPPACDLLVRAAISPWTRQPSQSIGATCLCRRRWPRGRWQALVTHLGRHRSRRIGSSRPAASSSAMSRPQLGHVLLQRFALGLSNNPLYLQLHQNGALPSTRQPCSLPRGVRLCALPFRKGHFPIAQPRSSCYRVEADRARHSVVVESRPASRGRKSSFCPSQQVCKLRCSQGVGPPLNSCRQVADLKRRTDSLVLTLFLPWIWNDVALVLGSLMRPQRDGVDSPNSFVCEIPLPWWFRIKGFTV